MIISKKKYIFSSRLENPKYEPRIWNLNGTIDLSIPRTNNAIEGRHRSLNSTFFTNKVSLPLLIEKLKDEEDQIRIKYIRVCCGEVIPRNIKYVQQENRLFEFMAVNQDENYGISFIFRLLDHIYY